MRLTTKSALGLCLFAVAAGHAMPAGADYWDNLDKLERLQRDEARGGPWIEGGRSPYQSRYKVCNELPTRIHDKSTSRRRTVMKKRCWFE